MIVTSAAKPFVPGPMPTPGCSSPTRRHMGRPASNENMGRTLNRSADTYEHVRRTTARSFGASRVSTRISATVVDSSSSVSATRSSVRCRRPGFVADVVARVGGGIGAVASVACLVLVASALCTGGIAGIIYAVFAVYAAIAAGVALSAAGIAALVQHWQRRRAFRMAA